MFDQLPTMAKMILQNGIVTGSITAVVLNMLLVHGRQTQKRSTPVHTGTVTEA
jgi:xanthine permease